jgi:hemoglobin-like flavoprotein
VEPASIETFLASLKRCLAEPGFMERFYERFVGSSEAVREKFRGTDMARQARVLADSLYVVANAVQGSDHSAARGDLPGIAERHDRSHMDIAPELYDLWVDTLVATARDTDPRFGPAAEQAWRETLEFGARYMRERY